MAVLFATPRSFGFTQLVGPIGQAKPSSQADESNLSESQSYSRYSSSSRRHFWGPFERMDENGVSDDP